MGERQVTEFKVGDRVRMRSDGEEGVVVALLPGGVDYPVVVEFDEDRDTYYCADWELEPVDGGEPEQPGPTFEESLAGVFREAQNLLLRKHHDYGPTNISRSPGGSLNGLRVRMWDKMARINNLIDSGVEPTNESLRDSFIDLANYSIIALLVLDGNWPEGDR